MEQYKNMGNKYKNSLEECKITSHAVEKELLRTST